MKAMLKAVTVAAALIALATPAMAVDFVGYFRDGTALSGKGGPAATFQTPGMDYKLRLGNENDWYGEWGLEQTIYKDKAGVEAKAGVMFAYYGGASTGGGAGDNLSPSKTNPSFGIQQNYVTIKFPQWAGAKVWGGKLYYQRENVDMIDLFYLNTGSVPGVGVTDVDVGMGKLSFSIFGQGANDSKGNTNAYVRPDFRWTGIPVWTGGTLTFDLNAMFTSRHSDPAKGKPDNESTAGIWATGEWNQSGILGGSNAFVVQYATGTNAGMGTGVGFCGGQVKDPTDTATPPEKPSVCGTQVDSDKNAQFRIIDALVLQPSNVFQVTVGATYQYKKFGLVDGTDTTVTSYGAFARPVFWVSDYFKIQGDLGYTNVKPKDADAMNMIKWSIAPTLSAAVGEGGGMFVRPEIRLFVTGAVWNDAAQKAVDFKGKTVIAGGNYGTDKSGILYGAQVETWF